MLHDSREGKDLFLESNIWASYVSGRTRCGCERVWGGRGLLWRRQEALGGTTGTCKSGLETAGRRTRRAAAGRHSRLSPAAHRDTMAFVAMPCATLLPTPIVYSLPTGPSLSALEQFRT